MKNEKNFYITTTLPYVNAPLHLGHATEIIRADALARYKKLVGFDVFFNTGTDEHGQKMYESAIKAGKTTNDYVNEYAALFKETVKKFGISDDVHFIRTTDDDHIKSAQAFWKKVKDNGYIYKKNYQTKYCVGCEEEKTDSELVDGKCPVHNRVPELIDEENYFFKFSAFEKPLLEYYEANPKFILPESRMNEAREFIKRGLHDFSISRLKSKMAWGIEVPDDTDHVMYVWFDALVNYVSTLGWPDNENFEKYWRNGTPTQYCGKDNTRFQGVMWQAMLLAAGIPLTHTIVVDGFILGEGGVKMSKTLGNVINPLDIVSKFGIDGLRYFVLRSFHPFDDTAVSNELLLEWYNTELANGLGNLVSRIMKMATTNITEPISLEIENTLYPKEYIKACEAFDFKSAMDYVWSEIATTDRLIQEKAPFKLVKTDKEAGIAVIKDLLLRLSIIARLLSPFLPQTSAEIKRLISENQMPSAPLFGRIE